MVYALAQLPPPATPTPIGPPARPTNVDATLDMTNGALVLRWKATNPKGAAGTSYIVQRKLPGETAFSYIGTTGAKTFTDATLPAGVEQASYTVQGQRSDLKGPVSAIFTVVFGRAASGELTSVTAQAAAPKLAA